MIILFDIGNTHTHVGHARNGRIVHDTVFATSEWTKKRSTILARALPSAKEIEGASLCSVVPAATRYARNYLHSLYAMKPLVLSHRHLARLGMGIDYPKPASIGPDRLANALAACHHLGKPSVVVDLGTAVTFDVVNRQGNYAGGIIAPGLAAMTHYLHEKTALLPEIEIRETRAIIGKSTEQAMLIGAVHGYRGLIKGLIERLQKGLRCSRLPVVATGGCARLLARTLPEIQGVDPLLTLKGLLLAWEGRKAR